MIAGQAGSRAPRFFAKRKRPSGEKAIPQGTKHTHTGKAPTTQSRQKNGKQEQKNPHSTAKKQKDEYETPNLSGYSNPAGVDPTLPVNKRSHTINARHRTLNARHGTLTPTRLHVPPLRPPIRADPQNSTVLLHNVPQSRPIPPARRHPRAVDRTAESRTPSLAQASSLTPNSPRPPVRFARQRSESSGPLANTAPSKFAI